CAGLVEAPGGKLLFPFGAREYEPGHNSCHCQYAQGDQERSLVPLVPRGARFRAGGYFTGLRFDCSCHVPHGNIASAVSAAAHAPGVTRTRGQQFRKLLLYPSELRGPELLLFLHVAELPRSAFSPLSLLEACRSRRRCSSGGKRPV